MRASRKSGFEATSSARALMVLSAELCVFGPERHEAPAHEGELWLAGIGVEADDWLNALRRCVVGGREDGHLLRFDTEPVGEDFLSGSTSETATHMER